MEITIKIKISPEDISKAMESFVSASPVLVGLMQEALHDPRMADTVIKMSSAVAEQAGKQIHEMMRDPETAAAMIGCWTALAKAVTSSTAETQAQNPLLQMTRFWAGLYGLKS